ncbi:MAG: hypothetical protein GC179_08960 [Anaerolineaceae bacterium]|nr:hypothetical protein [Anaerolineaceae bacterium]
MLNYFNRRIVLTLSFIFMINSVFAVQAQSIDPNCTDMVVVYSDDALTAKPVNDLSQSGKHFIKSIEELQPYDLAWADSADRLVFTSAVDNSVYVSDKLNITPQLIFKAEPNIQLSNFTWSPDGQFLAYYKFIVDVAGNAEKTTSFIEAYDFETKQIKQILDPFHDQAFTSSLESLVWSPDGKQIAVTMGVLPYESKLHLINTDCLRDNQAKCDLQKLEVKNINNWEYLTEGQTHASWSNDGRLWFICGGEYCVYDPQTHIVERYTIPDLQGFMLLSCSNNFIFWTNDRTLNLYNVIDKIIVKRTKLPIPDIVIPFPVAEFLFTK